MDIFPKKNAGNKPPSDHAGNRAGNTGGGNPKGKKEKNVLLRKIGTIVACAFMVCVILGSVMASVVAVYVFKYIENEPNIDLDELPFSYTTIFYADDADGEPMEVDRIHGNENRIWVEIDKIPEHMQKAAIAAEDKRFNEHNGVDWRRTIFATFKFFTDSNSSQGGSTITQQLIKNVTNDKSFSWQRKAREIFSALQLSKEYSREQILEAYLNTVALGNNTNGVQAASNLYFNKDVSELDLVESCTILAITQNPTRFDPLRTTTSEKYGWGTGLEENKIRRNYILEEMKKLDMITAAEYDEYSKVDVEIYKKTKADEEAEVKEEEAQKAGNYQSWFIDHVMEEVIEDLMAEYGYTYAEAEYQLLNGGLRVYTTMVPSVQSSLEASYKNNANFPKLVRGEYPETAFVVIKPDGSVSGIIGGNEKTGDRAFNRATMAKLSPGSTIKPISAYLQAFEMDMVTWSTVMTDAPIKVMNEGKLIDWPINYYKGYLGPMRVVEAIQRSTNTIPAQLVDEIGTQQCYDFLVNKLGFSKLKEGQDNVHPSAMTLGGLNGGITPLEMVGAYQIFATGGKYVKPYSYTRVLDGDGNIVLEKDTTQVRVISAETATVINRLLQMVTTQAPGTGTAANLGGNIPVAGKTGSTSDNKDLWFIGVTPYYIGGCWMGYDEPDTVYYGVYPTPVLWKNMMAPILRNMPAKNFEYSSSVVNKVYCMDTGDLATSACPKKANGWYKESYIPTECYIHGGGGGGNTDTSTGDEEDNTDEEDWPWNSDGGE